jgi:hypothetical protein
MHDHITSYDMNKEIPKSLPKAECISKHVAMNWSQPTNSARGVIHSQSFIVAPYRSNANNPGKGLTHRGTLMAMVISIQACRKMSCFLSNDV